MAQHRSGLRRILRRILIAIAGVIAFGFLLAGLTPTQVLQAAIITPADYAKATVRFADVAPQKIADLIVLTANPLEDIGNTRKSSSFSSTAMYTARQRSSESSIMCSRMPAAGQSD